jgi:hypothetical protein
MRVCGTAMSKFPAASIHLLPADVDKSAIDIIGRDKLTAVRLRAVVVSSSIVRRCLPR